MAVLNVHTLSFEFNVKEIEETLAFIVEIEKLKAVHRKTKPVGLDRFENSAEHSWHVCISALMLQKYSNDKINIDRVIKMLLIHDLGEIDADDTIIYSSDNKQVKGREEAGLRRVLGVLPSDIADKYINLWCEFELGESSDALYARAIDRVPPILHNLYGDGHSWRKHNISPDKVLSVNSRISKGSAYLWNVLKRKIDNVVIGGRFKETFNK